MRWGSRGRTGRGSIRLRCPSKRWVDGGVGRGDNPSDFITDDDDDGEWDDNLPMACHRVSILETLEPYAADV